VTCARCGGGGAAAGRAHGGAHKAATFSQFYTWEFPPLLRREEGGGGGGEGQWRGSRRLMGILIFGERRKSYSGSTSNGFITYLDIPVNIV
jgi:hypothetical protein